MIHNQYTCHTGGADGSDQIFADESLKYNFKVIAYSFDGHNTDSRNRKILSQEELDEGFEHIKIANKTLKRNTYNLSKYVKNLLSRNWYQVKNSDAIFAIGTLESRMGIKLTAIGGTGWATQSGIDNNKPVFFFDQDDNKWYEFVYEEELKKIGIDGPGRFIPITFTPTLTENFAGIGTRKINENGVKAIKELLKNKMK